MGEELTQSMFENLHNEIDALRAELKSAVGILRNIDGYADDCECFQCQNIKSFLANHSAPQESAP